MHELDDFAVGDPVLTPSGRRATVIKLLSGASKRDAFDRIMCHYDDGGRKDLVTLQPYQLRHVEVTPTPPMPQQPAPAAAIVQFSFAF